jgi:hypothetical protein
MNNDLEIDADICYYEGRRGATADGSFCILQAVDFKNHNLEVASYSGL